MTNSSPFGDCPILSRPAVLPREKSLPLSSLKIYGAEGDKQSRINGEYFEVSPCLSGHAPVYRQSGGDYWLYFATATRQWHIGYRQGAKDRIPNGFVYSHPAVPGSCASEAWGWSGKRTKQPSLVVVPVACPDCVEGGSHEPDARDRRSFSSPPVRPRALTWRDRADRGWGDGSYKLGDVTRSAAVKVRESLKSSRKMQCAVNMDMEAVQLAADAHRQLEALERSLCTSTEMDSAGPSSFFAAK